ncbi:lipoprotein, putative [Edwardsiella ictaluri 93-146]|uniref:Lipoprotein, putative n=1 Tax=Edwardsiella ictaluri (strain 93-146) TaxID=634503 RepID=C5BDC7_EDWI9|nr:lipoprotein, putative [Edwardsiella ictaluri 93-146]
MCWHRLSSGVEIDYRRRGYCIVSQPLLIMALVGCIYYGNTFIFYY